MLLEFGDQQISCVGMTFPVPEDHDHLGSVKFLSNFMEEAVVFRRPLSLEVAADVVKMPQVAFRIVRTNRVESMCRLFEFVDLGLVVVDDYQEVTLRRGSDVLTGSPRQEVSDLDDRLRGQVCVVMWRMKNRGLVVDRHAIATATLGFHRTQRFQQSQGVWPLDVVVHRMASQLLVGLALLAG